MSRNLLIGGASALGATVVGGAAAMAWGGTKLGDTVDQLHDPSLDRCSPEARALQDKLTADARPGIQVGAALAGVAMVAGYRTAGAGSWALLGSGVGIGTVAGGLGQMVLMETTVQRIKCKLGGN